MQIRVHNTNTKNTLARHTGCVQKDVRVLSRWYGIVSIQTWRGESRKYLRQIWYPQKWMWADIYGWRSSMRALWLASRALLKLKRQLDIILLIKKLGMLPSFSDFQVSQVCCWGGMPSSPNLSQRCGMMNMQQSDANVYSPQVILNQSHLTQCGIKTRALTSWQPLLSHRVSGLRETYTSNNACICN